MSIRRRLSVAGYIGTGLSVLCLLATACGSGSTADAPAFACPRKPPAEARMASLNAHSGTDDEFVPGSPDRLLLCRYWGLNHGSSSLRLAAKRLVREPGQVSRYARAMDHLHPWPEGTYACPEDDGSRNLALFAYPEEAPAVVEISLTGCADVANGRAPSSEIGPLESMLGQDVPLPRSRLASFPEHCPAEPPYPFEPSPSPGKTGRTVRGPAELALVCRWNYAHGHARRDAVTLQGTKVDELVRSLNSLPEVDPGEETEGCGGGPEIDYLVVLGYADRPVEKVAADLGEGAGCDAAVNLGNRKIFAGNGELRSVLDESLAAG